MIKIQKKIKSTTYSSITGNVMATYTRMTTVNGHKKPTYYASCRKMSFN